MSEALTAFRYLSELARRSRNMGSGELSEQVDTQEALWSGIGFAIGAQHCVVPMGEIAEVLSEPPVTRLPGVKSWIKGVANVRGRLLPLMDLAGFLDGDVAVRQHRRVVVLERGDIYTGLIVDEVFGIQHFHADSFRAECASVAEPMQRFVDGVYRQGSKEWALFRPLQLMEVRDFYDVAV
ncbi:chemotaxis protein CheW [Spongiibacter sp.]|uniref:chemotaxis protein CheW n=1 Tax=Spongiibacter sp. TaxID=2024860 RepID=UPI0035696A92